MGLAMLGVGFVKNNSDIIHGNGYFAHRLSSKTILTLSMGKDTLRMDFVQKQFGRGTWA